MSAGDRSATIRGQLCGGNVAACREVFGPDTDDQAALNCDTLWREYLQALDRERQALLDARTTLGGDFWSPMQGPVLQTKTESETLYQQYRASYLGPLSLG